MRSAVLILIVLAVAFASRREFLEFQRKFKKVYPTHEEFQKRFQIFEDNLAWAKELTRLNNGTAQFGVTRFSDLSREEFARFYLMPNFDRNHPKPPPVTSFPEKPRSPNADPNNFDWNKQGVVTPVYDQGQCGSCWAFSATETIESYFALAGGTLQGMSMEQIVDCDTAGQDEGCNGGFPTDAYQYVQSAGGIDSLSSYPYTAGGGTAGSCSFSSSNVVANVASQASVSGEDQLYQTVYKSGPVSVCVAADTWQTYTGGIISTCDTQIDHCVQLTGYQNYDGSQGTPAWIVRNSWGASWGESGYIRVQIGSDLCGIGDEATVVTTQ